MVPPGGSSTLYGVLYQLLGSLGHVVQLRLQKRGGKVLGALVTVEPRDGGDIKIELPGQAIREQWKARTTPKLWSLRDIGTKVLPDLYLDPELDDPNGKTEYVFATEGKPNEEARAFFERFRGPAPEGDPFAGFGRGDRTIFREIVKAIRKRKRFRTEPDGLTYPKLRRLLSRFEIREGQKAEDLARAIDHQLLPLVDYREDVVATRDRLCGMILSKAARGEVEIVPEDLLREAGLRGVSLERVDELRRRAGQVLGREVARRKYDKAKDVREAPVWPADRYSLFLSGESGQGKTWQTAQLAEDRAKAGRIVVVVDSRGDAERDLQRAADLLWKEAWAHDRSISLDRLVERWHQVRGKGELPWLTICVENVQSLNEAKALLRDYDWEQWGVELALTGPPQIGTVLAEEHPERVHHVRLRDFTPAELREYLRRHGRSWSTVPADVRDTLKRPLLAGLYTSLGSDPNWTPNREYVLYEQSWQKVEREFSEHPEDLHLAKQLAVTLLDDDSRYPWTWDQLRNAGVDPEARARLERVGWWIRNDEGVEVWHDRMLSWVLAKAIVERWTGSDLADRIMTCLNSERSRIGRILGYVPMDVLWLVSGSPDRQQLVPDLIVRLEEDDAFGHRSLYQNLLPTLGRRAVPGILERLRQVADRGRRRWVTNSVETISRILDREPDGCPELPKLPGDPSLAVRDTAVGVLKRHPHPGAAESLWHLLRTSSLAIERERSGLEARQAAFSALRACLDIDPEWLRSKILAADPEAEPIWELAYLLANLKHPSARSIWFELKGELFRKIPSRKRKALAVCIRIFDDRDEVSQLESWLSIEEGEADRYAFRALAWVAPDRAVALLKKVPLKNLRADHAGSWPAPLLAKWPDETRRALRERMASAGQDFWQVAYHYTWYEERIDRETLDLLLDRLTLDIAGFSGRLEEAWDPLWHPLRFVAGIHRLDLLQGFEKRAGTDLDRGLGDLGAAWVDSPGQYELEQLYSILLKIGGEGLRRLIRAGLSSADPERKDEALAWGMTCPEEISAAAPRTPWNLAALGDDAALVEAMLGREEEIENDWLANLWRLRRGRPPMTDADLAPAFEALASGDLQKRIRGLAAVSISGRADLLDRLPEWLERLEGPDSADFQRMDACAAFLVHRFAKDNPEAARRLAQILDPQRFPGPLAELLGKLGAEDLPDRLEQHLLGRLNRFRRVEMTLALSLRSYKDMDASLLRAIWSYGRNNPGWNREIFWETVARLDAEEVHEEVWKTSLDRGHFDERSEGIAALRHLEPQAAFEIATEHLRGTGNNRVEFVRLLMSLDPQRAVPVLIEQAIREKQTEVLWAIARSLRWVGPQVEAELRTRLRSSEFRVRCISVHLAGWQGPGFLREELQRLAQDDPDRDIQWECLWALNRQDRERFALELMDAFRQAQGISRWSYLESILELGDPRLLVNEDDPLWLGRILTEELGVLEVHANARLKQRFDKVKRSAEQRDRDNED